jgi:hypothetical protein
MNMQIRLVHTVLPIIGRVLAGAVGCLAFYIALFMYRDEKEKWQNRLEGVWLEIYDRAKSTDTRFTALVNNVALQLSRAFDTVFGAKAMSFKLVTTSVNISLSGFLLVTAYAHMDSWGVLDIHYIYSPHIVFYIWVIAPLICVILLSVPFHRKWINWFGVLPACCFFVLACRLPGLHGIWSLNGFWRQSWVSVDEANDAIDSLVGLATPLAFLLSVVTDTVCVVVLKKIFNYLANAPSVKGVVAGGCSLLLLASIVNPLPLQLSKHLFKTFDAWSEFPDSEVVATQDIPRIAGAELTREFAACNAITVLYVMLPCVVLTVLLLHKFLWPILARFTYPLLDFEALTERKFLISIGAIAFGIAFGLTTIMEVFKKHIAP